LTGEEETGRNTDNVCTTFCADHKRKHTLDFRLRNTVVVVCTQTLLASVKTLVIISFNFLGICLAHFYLYRLLLHYMQKITYTYICPVCRIHSFAWEKVPFPVWSQSDNCNGWIYLLDMCKHCSKKKYACIHGSIPQSLFVFFGK